MNTSSAQLHIEHNAPVSTWFHIGGGAKMLARPQSSDDLLACLQIDDDFVVLGEGANLLVDDEGVDGLVVSLQGDGFSRVEIDASTGMVRAGAGAALPSLINRCVRQGLGGLEVLAGIPATVGGAVIMNAGGAFGSMSDVVHSVSAMDRVGRLHELDRSQIDFDYRQSLLNHLLITEVIFQLTPGDAAEIKASLARCMEYKSGSQPLGAKSAGCVFKNPVLNEPIEGIGEYEQRVSAGMLIDRAGCKGLSLGGAQVSDVHANFITTTKDAQAREVIGLIAQVHDRVRDRFGVSLSRELVIWGEQA